MQAFDTYLSRHQVVTHLEDKEEDTQRLLLRGIGADQLLYLHSGGQQYRVHVTQLLIYQQQL